jgi:hypothetical protein
MWKPHHSENDATSSTVASDLMRGGRKWEPKMSPSTLRSSFHALLGEMLCTSTLATTTTTTTTTRGWEIPTCCTTCSCRRTACGRGRAASTFRSALVADGRPRHPDPGIALLTALLMALPALAGGDDDVPRLVLVNARWLDHGAYDARRVPPRTGPPGRLGHTP